MLKVLEKLQIAFKRMHENLPQGPIGERGVSCARQRGFEAHDVRVDHKLREERCHESTNDPLELEDEVVDNLALAAAEASVGSRA